MEEGDIAELETLIRTEANEVRVGLDSKDLMLVNQDAINFLERCEAENITLKNCPAYIREWIRRQRGEGKVCEASRVASWSKRGARIWLQVQSGHLK